MPSKATLYKHDQSVRADFEALCDQLGKSRVETVPTSDISAALGGPTWFNVGAWQLRQTAAGYYKIVEITDHFGNIRHPFGPTLYTARELSQCISFALRTRDGQYLADFPG